ncbi:MAG: glucuronate isomerase [Clostridia bacterium]|nr:glucuronate isomerase [Clostridia bacterium]
MSAFLTSDFLLHTDVAKRLYHECAETLPIIDYHCHVSPKEIYEDCRFENVTQLWLGGDHYKWRLMRSNGIDERYITGDASDYDKFLAFARTLPLAIGNPMYHWCHLELKKYFGFEGVLNEETAPAVWKLCEEKLKDANMSVRGIIRQSGVEFIGTTDDPVDDLKYHKLLSEDESLCVRVAPSFRPDRALNLTKSDFPAYILRLGEVCKMTIGTVSDLKAALRDRIEYFNSCGCKASDHGLDRAVYERASEEELNFALQSALNGQAVQARLAEAFQTELLLFCAAEYTRLGWVMQIHYNCLRNPNSKALATLGVDRGFDCIGPDNGSRRLASLLDALYSTDTLPRTILYSLDPADNAFLDTLIGAFQGTEVAGKLQHGSAWWFNDQKQGMRDQLTSLANLSLLGNFVGMLTDSRSFLSYTRHEYFRRILCALIGEWVENGEYPNDFETLSRIVRGICYENARRYFDL